MRMNPPISFDTNSGLQVGINQGSINTQFHIQNITTIRPLAHSIYKSLFSASDLFGQVRNELGLLISVLNATEEHTPKFRAGDPQIPELNHALSGCRMVLQDLQRLKEHFDNVGPQTQVTWERMGWGVEELAEIRGKLSLQIQVLNLLNTTMLRSSHENVERMLKTFIREIQSGKRESAAMSNASASSLSINEQEAWRTLRKELQGIGITPDLFMQHREFILGTLQAHLSEHGIGRYPSHLDPSRLNRRVEREIDTKNTHDSESLAGLAYRSLFLEAPSLDMFRVLYIGSPDFLYIVDRIGTALLLASIHPSPPTQAISYHQILPSDQNSNIPVTKLAEVLPDNVLPVIDELNEVATDFHDTEPNSLLLRFRNRPSCLSWWVGDRYKIFTLSEWTLPNVAVIYMPDKDSPNPLRTQNNLRAFLERHRIPVLVVSNSRASEIFWAGVD